MRRCACFVPFIPYREATPFYNCSPYQLFENGLAVHSKKPHLIFVKAGLVDIFEVQPTKYAHLKEEQVFRSRSRKIDLDG